MQSSVKLWSEFFLIALRPICLYRIVVHRRRQILSPETVVEQALGNGFEIDLVVVPNKM
jgi:hypothetical protein